MLPASKLGAGGRFRPILLLTPFFFDKVHLYKARRYTRLRSLLSGLISMVDLDGINSPLINTITMLHVVMPWSFS